LGVPAYGFHSSLGFPFLSQLPLEKWEEGAKGRPGVALSGNILTLLLCQGGHHIFLGVGFRVVCGKYIPYFICVALVGFKCVGRSLWSFYTLLTALNGGSEGRLCKE
jgi:hypothetical protein